MWYWNPEQPPPTTATRSATGTGFCIPMISLTLVFAVGVRLIMISGPPPRRFPRESLPLNYNRKRTAVLNSGFRSRSFQETGSSRALLQHTLHPVQLDATMRHKVTLLPGEGIGPEVSRATCKILAAAGVQIDWEEIDARAAANAEAGQVLHETAVESGRRKGVGRKPPMGTAT